MTIWKCDLGYSYKGEIFRCVTHCRGDDFHEVIGSSYHVAVMNYFNHFMLYLKDRGPLCLPALSRIFYQAKLKSATEKLSSSFCALTTLQNYGTVRVFDYSFTQHFSSLNLQLLSLAF